MLLPSENFLWLSMFLKYKSIHCTKKIFGDAQQSVVINSNFKSYNKIAAKYNLIPNYRSFIEYIEFMSAVPHHWKLNSEFHNQRIEFFENVLQNLQLYLKSTNKSFYDYLFSNIESLPR